MFEAIIVSAQFEKKMTLARHRLVNAALKEEIAAIHALRGSQGTAVVAASAVEAGVELAVGFAE